MARRKKSDALSSATVQKSRLLFDLWKYNFKLFDFKVFDLYLSAINSRDINTKIVTFSKAEFSQILEISQGLSTDELDTRLAYLRQKEISINTNSKYPIHTSLFSACYVDTSQEPYQVKLEVSETLLSIIFNIDKVNGHGYFGYKLKNILKIESLYSYLLFNYLENKAYRQSGKILLTTVKIDLRELKKMLNCDDVKVYADFKHFNDKVLKKCHQEITSKTDLKFNYKTVKQGRKVIAVEFTIQPFAFSEQQPDRQTIQQENIVSELMQKPVAAQSKLNEQETNIQQSEFEYLTANQCKSLLSEISLKYDEYTDRQCEKKLKALYYACVDRCKNKNNLFMYIKSTLDNETIPQPKRKTDVEDTEYNDMYDIFINNFVKSDTEE